MDIPQLPGASNLATYSTDLSSENMMPPEVLALLAQAMSAQCTAGLV